MSYYYNRKKYYYKQPEKYCAYCGDYSGEYELCYDCYQDAQTGNIIKNEYGEWVENNYYECAYCGDYSGKYELCLECYNSYLCGDIIKNEKGEWIKNIRKGNEYKFYDETKEYYLKTNLLNEFEMRYFNIIRKNINKKYLIVPQVNLQSIIETNSNKRNDELFRNIDFVIYHTKDFNPFLAIEINGKQHYTKDYWIERDKSVKQILTKANLPLLTIDVSRIKQMNDTELLKKKKKVIRYLNPNFITRLFKKYDLMDLTWTESQCKYNK